MKIKFTRRELLLQSIPQVPEDICPQEICLITDCDENCNYCPLSNEDYLDEEIEIEIPDEWAE